MPVAPNALTESPVASCQRWRHGRTAFRSLSADTAFDRRRYSVDALAEQVAKRFIGEHHYSRSYPAAVFRVGLFGIKGRLEGVCVFSVPMNQRVVPAYTGLAPNEGVELGRFVLLDETPCNGESFFLGRAFELLRQDKPHLRSVVSYSDPVARHTADGSVLTPGHVGIIYQAHNGRYLGRGSARTLHMARDGRVVSPRTLSKIRLGEKGWEPAQRSLENMGAPAREFGESGSDWVTRVLASELLRPVRHPGNHCYAWALGKGAQRRQLESGFRTALPYPKQRDGQVLCTAGEAPASMSAVLSTSTSMAAEPPEALQ